MFLTDPYFTDWLPIWVWVIEHPDSNSLVDTGENVNVNDEEYFLAAGAIVYYQRQLLNNQLAESHVSKRLAKKTYRSIKKFAPTRKLVFLPSHEWEAKERLEKMKGIPAG